MYREPAKISFDLCMGAVGKSGRVLYAFTEFYLHFYEIEPAFLFLNFPVFGCISAAIYCVDESVEQKLPPRRGVSVDDLEKLLRNRIKVNEHISRLLCDARDYCAFEQAARAGREVHDLREVLRISEIRSVDFRLMHHALLQLRSIPYDEEVFEWFKSFEVLMEIEDDLPTVKEDERKGGYNYYCWARKIVGEDVGPVVEGVRTGLEKKLQDIGASLFVRGFTRCSSVVEKYRGIVPRPQIPSWNKQIQ